MFGIPGRLGAKLGDFGLWGWGAHVCYSLPRRRVRLRFANLWGELFKIRDVSVLPFDWVNYSIHGPPGPPTPEKGPITMEFDEICF